MTEDFLSKVFQHASSGPSGLDPLKWQPAADVFRTREGWLLKLELAGVRKEDIQVEASGRSLTIHGVRRDRRESASGEYHILEIAYNKFERRFQLPSDIEGARIETEYLDGMLHVRVITEVARP